MFIVRWHKGDFGNDIQWNRVSNAADAADAECGGTYYTTTEVPLL